MTADPKFAFALLVLLAATGLLLLGKIAGPDWVTTTTWVTGAYMLGQAAGIAATGYVTTASARVEAIKRGVSA